MSEQSLPPDPSPDEPGRQLHLRLLAGDLTASAEIAEAYLPGLVEYMRRRYPWVHDPHLPESAASVALCNYLKQPAQYDPRRLSLDGYLRMAARGDLRNALAGQARQRKARGQEHLVELDAPGAEHQVVDESGLSVAEQAELLASPVWEQLDKLLPRRADRLLVLLLMDGVRETHAYAEVLGITQQPPDVQAHEVKRHKDRLKQWLRRHMNPQDLRDHD